MMQTCLLSLHVHVLQAAPLGEGIVFHLGVVLVHTVNTGAVAVGRGAHLGALLFAEIDLGRDCGDELLVSYPQISYTSSTEAVREP